MIPPLAGSNNSCRVLSDNLFSIALRTLLVVSGATTSPIASANLPVLPAKVPANLDATVPGKLEAFPDFTSS